MNTLLNMSIQLSHPLSKENRMKWTTLFFFCYGYIPLQKYTVSKNETLRYRQGLGEETPMPTVTRRWMSCPCLPQFSLIEKKTGRVSHSLLFSCAQNPNQAVVVLEDGEGEQATEKALRALFSALIRAEEELLPAWGFSRLVARV